MTEEDKKYKRYIVTSALPYVNNIPHLGNLVCVISADVFARFLKISNKNVISILGTDEHGTTTEVRAIEEHTTPEEICNKYRKIHKEIYDYFECEPDCFGATSSEENKDITIDIFNKLDKNGYIIEGETEQLYCEHCKRFLSDRYVVGTCPYCGYENARGDQCENCGHLLTPTELINPRCKICGNTPVLKKSKHLFLNLEKLQPEIENFFNERKSNWSENAVTTTETWLKNGLKNRSITRDLKWGIPVPKKGYENKVFYSWFDAPIGYIGITKENRKDWYEWWHDDENTELIQFMGKDNIPFHTILFPAFLIGTKDNYTLLHRLSVNEYLNYNNEKFSKSASIGFNGLDAVKLSKYGITADIWRYYLMINRPEKSDTSFNWDDFFLKLNTELVGNLGNLIYRAVSFINNFYDSSVPEAKLTQSDLEFIKKFKDEEDKAIKYISNIEQKRALKQIMKLSKILNQYFQENQPWKNIKDKKTKAITDNTLYIIINLIKDISILIYPFMPQIAHNITDMLNLKSTETTSDENDKNNNPTKFPLSINDLSLFSIESNHHLNKAEILFKKFNDKDINKIWQVLKMEQTNNKQDKNNKKNSSKDNNNEHNKTDKTNSKAVNNLKSATGEGTNNHNNLDNKNNSNNQNTNNDTNFNIVNLKVAEITSVEDHPNADRLYVMKINLGTENRQLVGGLKKYYNKEELKGKHLVIITNLKHAVIRGIESQGMLLAGEDKEGNVKVLEAPNSEPGSQVYLEGEKNKLNEINQNTITIDDFFKLGLKVVDGFATYNNKRLRTDSENIRCDITNGLIR